MRKKEEKEKYEVRENIRRGRERMMGHEKRLRMEIRRKMTAEERQSKRDDKRRDKGIKRR